MQSGLRVPYLPLVGREARAAGPLPPSPCRPSGYQPGFPLADLKSLEPACADEPRAFPCLTETQAGRGTPVNGCTDLLGALSHKDAGCTAGEGSLPSQT